MDDNWPFKVITVIDHHAGTKRENLVPQKLYQRTEIHLRTFDQCPCSRLRAHSENRQAKEPLHLLCWDGVGQSWGQRWIHSEREGFPGPASSQYEDPVIVQNHLGYNGASESTMSTNTYFIS